MTAKERLHRLVDELSQSEVAAAERYLEYVRFMGGDRVLRALLKTPDDEPEAEEELAAVVEAEVDLHQGRVRDLQQAKSEEIFLMPQGVRP